MNYDLFFGLGVLFGFCLLLWLGISIDNYWYQKNSASGITPTAETETNHAGTFIGLYLFGCAIFSMVLKAYGFLS